MNNAIYVVFALTYLLIASRRLTLLPIGRPAGALLGAVLMVLVGALSPEETYKAIDYDTIVLLFGTMVLTVYLERAGFFEWLARRIISLCSTPMTLLLALAALSGVLSAFLVNDTVCLFLTPVVVGVCEREKLPFGPYLIALATSANIGSAATLVGNPQNMIIGSLSGFPFVQFMLFAAPAAGIGLLINMLLLYIFYRRRLPAAMECVVSTASPMNGHHLFLALAVTAGVIGGFFAGFHLGYTTLTGVVVLILADHKDPRDMFSRVDWSLLLFFCCLFVVIAGLGKTGIVEKSWKESAPYLNFTEALGLILFSGLMTIGSNLVSNVPMVLLTGPHLTELGSAQVGWVLLAFTTTVAGNFTLIGSVANIIVAERARDSYSLGFFEYLRFGLISTVLVLIAGVAVICFLMAG